MAVNGVAGTNLKISNFTNSIKESSTTKNVGRLRFGYFVGMALGVDENFQFEENVKQDLENGQIIVLGTDGIWEARNPKGEMFGKDHIYIIIREKANLNAKSILSKIIESLTKFKGNTNVEDDVTLVVIKSSPKF